MFSIIGGMFLKIHPFLFFLMHQIMIMRWLERACISLHTSNLRRSYAVFHIEEDVMDTAADTRQRSDTNVGGI
ncbi:hypothetical protein ACJX0J_015796, partial [Zea mays]